MKLHVVSGFLGSGKTTAIAAAVKQLQARGIAVAAITNDQGHDLVDTAYIRGLGIPTSEVSGGCFCCRFDELVSAIGQVSDAQYPSVVFAEAVGSCTDLAATVLRPLDMLEKERFQASSFSVFADIILTGNWLSGMGLPFSDDVCYIFEKQLDEASLVVLNKCDVVSHESGQRIADALQRRFPDTRILLHSSYDSAKVSDWLGLISQGLQPHDRRVDVDYNRYGSGEAELGWYNARISMACASGAGPFLNDFLACLSSNMGQSAFPVGHVKVSYTGDPDAGKLSMTSRMDWDGKPRIDSVGTDLQVLLNARVQCSEAELRRIVLLSLRDASSNDASRHYDVLSEEHFHPSFPDPTHRISW